MSNVIRSLVVKVGADLSDFSNGMKYLSKDLGTMSRNLGKMGASLTKSITVPAIAAATGLGAIAIKAGQAADELITLSNQTGISTKTLQELQYASRFVDVEVEDMAKGLNKVTKAMGTANKNGADYIELSGGLKVAMKDSNGQLLDTEEMFYKTVDALGAMTNETEREIAAQELFGRSYQDIMPLIKAGSGELKDLAKEAHDLGIVMSDTDVNALGKFDDSMQQLQAVTAGLRNKVAIALIPALEDLVPVVRDDIVPAVVKFADSAADLIQKFLELDDKTQKNIIGFAGIVIAAGPALTIMGKVAGAASNIAKMLSKATAASKGVEKIGPRFLGINPALGATLIILTGIVTAMMELNRQKEIWDNILGGQGLIDKNLNPADMATRYGTDYAFNSGSTQGVAYAGTLQSLNGGRPTPSATILGRGGTRPEDLKTTIDVGGTITIKGDTSKKEFDVAAQRAQESILNQLAREQRRNK